jgi:hypothetical protein
MTPGAKQNIEEPLKLVGIFFLKNRTVIDLEGSAGLQNVYGASQRNCLDLKMDIITISDYLMNNIFRGTCQK